jgi:hypothetical protein
MERVLPLVLALQLWTRHTIDNSSRGAGGVKLVDVNTDGRPDIVTGWEQGGLVRAYFNPSRVDSRSPWPQVTVGTVDSPGDAVFVDLDGDGAFDVVSSCGGRARSLYVHWAPSDPDRFWDPAAWSTQPIPAAANLQQWMFAMPMQVNGRNGVDLVAAGKNQNAHLGWLAAPAKPRDLAAWRWHPLRPVGWAMSIILADMDGDRDQDILFSDRRGPRSGVFWLENPGTAADQAKPWAEHPVGSLGREVMFIDHADFDGDGLRDVVAAVKPNEVHVHLRRDQAGRRWESSAMPLEVDGGTAKSVRIADIDLDGQVDIVVSNEQAADQRGVYYLSRRDGKWVAHDISGPEGAKFGLVELVDLDGDFDLDVLTTEEADGLGVVWYENPSAR